MLPNMFPIDVIFGIKLKLMLCSNASITIQYYN